MIAIVTLKDGTNKLIRYSDDISRSVIHGIEEALLWYEGEGYEDDTWMDEIKQIKIIY